MLEAVREPMAIDKPIPRFRLPFDPVFDLSFLRVTYNISKAVRMDPADYGGRFQLFLSLSERGLDEAAHACDARDSRIDPFNKAQASYQKVIRESLPQMRDRLGDPIRPDFGNRGELERADQRGSQTRTRRTAAELIERGISADSPIGRGRKGSRCCGCTWVNPTKPGERFWIVATRVRLRFDRPGSPTATWLKIASMRHQRFEEALKLDPRLFEAAYGLAVVEQDAGTARACRDAGRLPVARTPRTQRNSLAVRSSRSRLPMPMKRRSTADQLAQRLDVSGDRGHRVVLGLVFEDDVARIPRLAEDADRPGRGRRPPSSCPCG